MSIFVSQFELLFKDQAPPVGVEVETVLQGYFLEISNLEERDFLYDLHFVSLPASSGSASRRLDGNALVILDNPGASSNDNVFGTLVPVGGSQTDYRVTGLELRLAARATALVAVIPQIAATPDDPVPVDRNLEVRGYVELSLPVVAGATQSPRPVEVLVTPQHRAAFYRFPSTTTLADAELRNQLQASLPTGTGGALQVLPPDGLVT